MTRQPRPSRGYSAPPCSGRLAGTAPKGLAWPPHNCPHSPWRGAQMAPVGQTSGLAGCGWGFEADLIPAHSPMMSRTRTSLQSQSTDQMASRAAPAIASAGVARAGKRGPQPRAGRRARSQSAGPRPQVLPCPERYTVHIGLGHANISGLLCSSPPSDLRITSVFSCVGRGLETGTAGGPSEAEPAADAGSAAPQAPP